MLRKGGKRHATGAISVIQRVVERVLSYHHLFTGNSKCSILQCDFPCAYAKSMFYRLAGRALAGRVHTQLTRINVSLGSDKLDVTLSYASASKAAFSLGNFKVS